MQFLSFAGIGRCAGNNGENGRKFVMENLTREIGTQKYIDVIKSVAKG